jgi:hypothetical protein
LDAKVQNLDFNFRHSPFASKAKNMYLSSGVNVNESLKSIEKSWGEKQETQSLENLF